MKRLSTILDFNLAWKRIKNDQFNDLLPDILELRDVDYDHKAILADIAYRIDTDYQPSSLLQIDVPKKGYTLRPGCAFVPEDRIVYQAVVDYISRKVEQPPKEAVYSYRLNKNPSSEHMFEYWKPLWLESRKIMREIYDQGYCCLLRTDISAYFEHVNHNLLVNNILNPEVKNKQPLELLSKLLRKWAVSDDKHIGIPQGCDASSYLGNVHLRDMDKIMIREGFKYFRYSDEMYVLTIYKQEARSAIKLLIHELRKLHLNLQDAKTKIITDPDEVAKEIGTDEDNRLKDFDYEFTWRQKKRATEESEEEIIQIYKGITKNGRAKEIDISKFKWCIIKLRIIKSDKAVPYILNRLSDLPFLADSIFEYLNLFVKKRKVNEKIVAFLSSKNNIYEWQEMWLLLTLSKINKMDGKYLDVIRNIARNKDAHCASRNAALLVIGKVGDIADKKWIRDLYTVEDNPHIKRAIAAAVHSLPKIMRNKFYSEIENDSMSIKRAVRYLKQDRIQTI